MASLTRGYTFGSSETVTNTKLHSLVDAGSVSSIVDADISAGAAIVYTKLSLTGHISDSDISSMAAIVASKLDLTSPGAIGSTTPNTGAFSTLNIGTTNQGDVYYDNGTTITRLTPGTAGKVLQTQGSSANPQWSFPSGQLGSWGSFSTGSAIQATTDGFVIAVFNSGGGAQSFASLLSDSSSTPTTVRSQAGVATGGGNDIIGTLFSPVKKNDYYKINITGAFGSVTQGPFFIPLGV